MHHNNRIYIAKTMEVFEKIEPLKARLRELRNMRKSIGFVPTMGALHRGHISLIEQSVIQNEITIASIFVNPTQFNNPDDLKHYPRTMEADCAMLQEAGCNIVFTPKELDIYPQGSAKKFDGDFGYLEQVMEGKFRPGHFNGVALVVKRLFEIVTPNRAYFGEKDFQQLAIIKKMVKVYMTDANIEIIPCPIIRESDGLAMSSRNMLLTNDQRKNVALISQTLFAAKKLTTQYSVSELKKWVIEQINNNPFLKVEYFDIVDNLELQPIELWTDNKIKVGCVAVVVSSGDGGGKTIRLIDNIVF